MKRIDADSPIRIAKPTRRDQAGKVGLAILLWLLGVPGSLVLLYLLFA